MRQRLLAMLIAVIMLLVPASVLAQDNSTSDGDTQDTTDDPAQDGDDANGDGIADDPATDSSDHDPNGDTGQSSDGSSAACDDWRAEATGHIDAFWSGHKDSWFAFQAEMDTWKHDFYDGSYDENDERAFWDDYFDKLHQTRDQYFQEQHMFQDDLRNSYFEHCGHDGDYHPIHWEYPDPPTTQYYYDSGAGSSSGPYDDGYYGDKPYDADHDGTYDDRHHDEPYEETYSDECRAYDQERQQAFDDLREHYRQEWDALQDEWRTFEQGDHTEEEWQEFESDMRARERDLRNNEEADFHALHGQYPDNPDCHGEYTASSGGPGGPRGDDRHGGPGGDCDFRAMEDEFRRFEERVREKEDEYFQLEEQKRIRFEQRMEQKWQEFEQEDHTDAEWREFELFMEAEWKRFDDKLHQEAENFFQALDNERRAFEQKKREACGGPGDGRHDDARFDRRGPRGPGGPGDHDGFDRYDDDFRGDDRRGQRGPPGFDEERFHALHEEMELIRLECELDAREDFAALMQEIDDRWAEFDASDDGDHRSFEAEMEVLRARAELEMRQKMLECQQRIRDLWDENFGDELHEGRAHERLGSWTLDEDYDAGTAHLRGKYMSIKGDTVSNVLTEVSVLGTIWLAGISTDSAFDPESFDMGEDGRSSWLKAEGDGVRMRLHDNPAGLIRFQSEDGYAFFLQIPDYMQVTQVDAGWEISDGESTALVRVGADNSEYDASSSLLAVWDEAAFLLPDSADNAVLTKVANKHRAEINDAVRDHKLGAEITLAATGEGDIAEETLVYENVDVTVDEPPAEDTVSVTFSADSSEDGKTFVLNLDGQVIQVGDSVDITYYDIDEATGEETPATIQKAGGLSDILDATDDETAEYWIVEDEDGVQVMVSIPHWSTHRVQIESGGGMFDVPAPGFGAIGIGVLLGLVGFALVRRPQDE